MRGFTLPHPPRDSRTFKTDTGKGHMTVNRLDVLDTPEGAVLLQTVRSHDQYNTTIYGLNDRYRGIHAGRRVVMINPQDMPGLGVSDGDVVDLVGIAEDGVERRAARFRVVSYPTLAAARPRITRRPTRWCRWTARRTRAARPHPSRCSSGWSHTGPVSANQRWRPAGRRVSEEATWEAAMRIRRTALMAAAVTGACVAGPALAAVAGTSATPAAGSGQAR